MKSIKKLLSVFLAALMIMAMVSAGFVPSAATVCDHNIGAEYPDSTMVEFSREPATCQKTGFVNYECTNCYHTDSKILPIDPENHAFGTWQTIEGKEPGCVTEGEKIRYCACGASETATVPATGIHTYPDEKLLDFWWTEENAGVGTVHKGWTIIKLPTCTETGLAKSVCTECGGGEKIAEVRIHSADFIEAKCEASTCKSEGKSYVVCKKCNANYTLIIPVNENSHELVWKTTKEATCTAEGEEVLYCRWHIGLGAFETRAIPEKEHNIINYVYQNNATCTKDGTKKGICKDCGAEDTIPAEGTALICLKRWQFINSDNNCATGGEAQLACVYCKTVYEKKTFKAGEHINIVVDTVAATCNENGYKRYKCLSCTYVSDPIPGSEIASEGHNMVWVVKTPSNCISKTNKVEIGNCSVCGATEERITPYTHNYFKIAEGYEATCKENGITPHYRCLDCLMERESVVIPAFGHTDSDNNGACDVCYEWFIEAPDGTPTSCRCICHNPDGIAQLFYKIYLFFIKLFGAAQECGCGALHYKK